MHDLLGRMLDFTDRPVPDRGRLLLVAGSALLVIAIFLPLWQIHLVAPQYEEGLDLYIYSHKLVSGQDDQSLTEINSLNEYIGMQPIEEEDFSEMRFIPFLLGVFALLALRAAFFGRVRSAIDTFVLFVYFGAFSVWRFYYRLYTYGHELDPNAPLDAEPFTPVMMGKMQIANFDQYGFPREGTVLLFLAALCFAGAVWMGIRSDTVGTRVSTTGTSAP